MFGVGAPRGRAAELPEVAARVFGGTREAGGAGKAEARAREAGLPQGAGLERGRAADAKRRRSTVERPLTSKAADCVLLAPALRARQRLAEKLLGRLGAAPGVTCVQRGFRRRLGIEQARRWSRGRGSPFAG